MIDEGPGEHDAHLMEDDREETVPCAKCGEAIWAYSQRCPQCGIHFAGEAWQFKKAGEPTATPAHWWRWLVIVAMILALLMILL